MGILIKLLQFILCFSILILIHEFGHYIFARIFKVRVEKFYLFFNPWFSIWKKKIGDTEYGIGWLPLGGYCKIAGMIDESMDTEQMKQPPQPWEFRSRPAWQRLLIMTGGVLMNVVLAIVIYIGMSLTWGGEYTSIKDIHQGYNFTETAHEIGFRDGDKVIAIDGKEIDDFKQMHYELLIGGASSVTVERDGVFTTIAIPEDRIKDILKTGMISDVRIPFVIASVQEGGNASKAGIMAGDSITGVNGEQMFLWNDIVPVLEASAGQTVTLSLVRTSGGRQTAMELPVMVSEDGKIGVSPKPLSRAITYNFFQAIPAGFERAGTEISNYVKQMQLVFTPKTEAYKSLGGLITLGSVFPQQWDWYAFWHWTAFFSIILAIMNILPIPALDGGHVVFLLYEVVTRRKPSDKFMEVVQTIGLILVFALLLYANGNDIYRLFTKG